METMANETLEESRGMLEESITRFLTQEYSFDQRQRLRRNGGSAEVWASFAEMGWLGIPFSEEDGGFGGGAHELAMLLKQAGRALVTEPLQANLSLAGQLLARLARPQQRASWLAPMIEGQIKLAFAFAERQARHEIHDCQTVARREGEGFLLNGRKVSVVGGASADVFIVLARTSGDQYDTSGLSLFIVPVELDGVSRVCTDTFDGHGSCELRLCNVLVNGHSVLGGIGDGFSAAESAMDFGCVMACSEALGVLEVMLSDTLEYVKQRKQFGRPIGQNQALQHRLVDMHILLQEASQLVRAAVLGLVDDLPIEQQQERVSAAKIHIDHALRSIAQEAVQMHGAIGTTDELRVSHYFRRATAIRLQFGDTNWHTRRMGNLMRQRHVHMGDEARSADLYATSPLERAFIREVRTFIASNLDKVLATKVANEQLLSKDEFASWQHALARQGWLGYMWPKEYGGPDWTARQKFIFEAVCMEMDCPWIVSLGLRMAAPVIQHFGTLAQKDRFLPRILNCTEWWCQGYSEPNSGSDLSSLATRAERHGDHYVVNGQKIWTSYAHYADWMFCMVRTSKEERQQDGISFLLIDMKSPGIEVRPIIGMDGSHSLNSVFFTDVKVPVENLIGEEGQGWACAKYLLTHERLETSALGGCQRSMRRLLSVVFEPEYGAAPLADDQLFLFKVVDAQVRLRALELRVLDCLQQQSDGASLGPEVSELKIRGTELHQRIVELIMEAAGYDALSYQAEFVQGESSAVEVGPTFAATAAARYFNRRTISILGGSNEIQRNILAKAVLGL